MWILAKGEDKFREKTISFVPGLYKIFGKVLRNIYIATIDEILVNAADNIQRDKKTSVIKVNID
jgi:DNA topoisomerase II